jgi:hypothetical protein
MSAFYTWGADINGEDPRDHRDIDERLVETEEPHIDRDLSCPFCGHNCIEVYDQNDGYGRHIVSFMCDTELDDDSPKGYSGCDRTIEIYEDSVADCKADYRQLIKALG